MDTRAIYRGTVTEAPVTALSSAGKVDYSPWHELSKPLKAQRKLFST